MHLPFLRILPAPSTMRVSISVARDSWFLANSLRKAEIKSKHMYEYVTYQYQAYGHKVLQYQVPCIM